MLCVRLVPLREACADDRLRQRWARLEERALEPNPFFAPQMVLPAARHLGAGLATYLLLAEEDDELQFLMPVSAGSGRQRVPVRKLWPWMHDYCFLSTPLLAGGDDSDRVWAAVLDHLRRIWPASLLVMPLHPTEGPVVAALRRAEQQAGPAIRWGPPACRGFLRRRPEPTYVRERISGKELGNLARRRRQAGRTLGTAVTTVDRAATDVESAIEQFLELEARGWKGRAGTALSCRPGHDRFFREVARGFADLGRLMFLSLEAGPTVLAQTTALIAGEGLFGFKRAYDEAFASCSPGTLLDLDVIGWFHERRSLAWLDTCSHPDDVAGSRLFGDGRAVCTLAVPLSPIGTAAAAMVPAAVRVRRYATTSKAGQLVRQRRHARRKG
jgi:CelD/BcsL family acetyltransferase involved in cellulose biosynthesis